MPSETAHEYDRLFGHQYVDESDRLRLLCAALDGGTFDTVEALNPEPAWRCLEIGAGIGTVATWLAERCPQGEVVATDVETSLLAGIGRPNLTVVRHDVLAGDFPERSFDLIHARWVFCHLPDREAALRRVVRWLAPGGWLVIEDCADFAAASSANALFRKVMEGYFAVLRRSHGLDASWARSFPAPLQRLGLEAVGLAVQCPVLGAATPLGRFTAMSLARAKDDLIKDGFLAESEYDRAQDLLSGPDFWDLSMVNMAAWGRRPRSAPEQGVELAEVQ